MKKEDRYVDVINKKLDLPHLKDINSKEELLLWGKMKIEIYCLTF